MGGRFITRIALALFLASGFILLFHPSSFAQRAEAERWNRKGVSCYKNHEITNAINAFKKAIRADETYDQPHANLAQLYILIKLDDDAIEELEAASKYRKDSDNLTTLGILYSNKKDLDSAKTAFERALEVEKDYARKAEIVYDMALIEYTKGRYGKAEDRLQRAIAWVPENMKYHLLRAKACRSQDKLENAKKELNLILSSPVISPELRGAAQKEMDLVSIGLQKRATYMLFIIAVPIMAVVIGFLLYRRFA